jgi:sugar O-acyltransferase (sialic acid O-acetyltransferase NeuD family)
MKNKVVVLGSGGHASVIVDIFEQLGLNEILVMDHTLDGLVLNVDFTSHERDRYKETHLYFVAIGDNQDRKRWVQKLLNEKFHLASSIHPSAVVAKSATIGVGSCIMAGALINPYVTLNEGVIINTKASIDHHTQIGAFSHVAPGVTIAGGCNIGQSVFIGVGASVSNNLSITNDVIIGAGAVVIRSITEPGTYVGVPAKRIS